MKFLHLFFKLNLPLPSDTISFFNLILILLKGRKSTEFILIPNFFILNISPMNLIISSKSFSSPEIEPFIPSSAIRIVPLIVFMFINCSISFLIFLYLQSL